MLFTVEAIDLFIEFTEARQPRRDSKVAVKMHLPKTGISIKKVTFDDLLFKKETGQTREGKIEPEKIKLDRLTSYDSDLSARQSLTVDNKQSQKLPTLHSKRPIQLSHKSDSHRVPVFKEPDDEIEVPLQETTKYNFETSSNHGQQDPNPSEFKHG